MYLEENRTSRPGFELTKGETDPLIKKFIGVSLPVKGGSIVIETTYGETLWITKYDANGNITHKDREINQNKVLAIVQRADQLNEEKSLAHKKGLKRVFVSKRESESLKS
jgi:hypothetical protein